jgi:hypothetical protein
MNGEVWLSARISIAPQSLSAFSVTWFRAEASGPIPEWLLLLGAMGLHLFGEESDIIVQDRQGISAEHDRARLRLIWDVICAGSQAGPLSRLRHVGQPLVAPRAAQLLRSKLQQHLVAGYWDLPAGQGLPGKPAKPSLLGKSALRFPPWRNRSLVRIGAELANTTYARIGVEPEQRAENRDALVPRDALPALRPRTRLSRVLMRAAKANWLPSSSAKSRTVPLHLLPLVFIYSVVMVPIAAVLFVVLLAELVWLPTASASPEHRTLLFPVDPSPPFIQLHKALTLEGVRCLENLKNSEGKVRWFAHMAFVLAHYQRLMNPKDREEECNLAT